MALGGGGGGFLAWLFSKKTSRIVMALGGGGGGGGPCENLTFSNISVITGDIYLKLRVVVHYQKGNQPIPVGEVILQFFLTKLCSFFDLEFFKCSYSRALAPACSALVALFNSIFRSGFMTILLGTLVK